MDWLTGLEAYLLLLAQQYGYLGAFLASLVGSASIIFPVPSYVAVIALGAVLNPWLLGLSAGVGAALGELLGYALGYGGGRAIERRHDRLLKRTRGWVEERGMFPVIVLFAATPLPDDIIGILAGVIRYDIKRFFLASLIGKVISSTALAWTGYLGGEMVGEVNMALLLVLSVVFLLFAVQLLIGFPLLKRKKA